MKRTKAKYGVKHCQFSECAGKRVPATFMTSGMASPIQFACEEHKGSLAKEDDGYMSEGDRQSWGKLA